MLGSLLQRTSATTTPRTVRSVRDCGCKDTAFSITVNTRAKIFFHIFRRRLIISALQDEKSLETPRKYPEIRVPGRFFEPFLDKIHAEITPNWKKLMYFY
ncbi:MAG: hypothetical protein MJZ85_10535 [Bacteroidales bacterium]|nr:hypothetical protein [Bacteroidales bacterium]